MIDSWAEDIAVFLGRRNDGSVSIPVMKFALIIILNVLSIIAIVLLFGSITGTFKQSCLALFGFAVLRFFSGGIHVKSAVNCVIISTLLMLLIIYIPIAKEMELVMQISSSLLVAIYAPAYLKDHIRIKKRFIPFLRIISICIVLSNFYLCSSILTKCFFIQSITLIESRKRGGQINEISAL